MTKEYILKGLGNRNLNIMFGDFCYYNRHTLHERYTPLGIGIIAQYTKEQFGEDVQVSIYKSIDKFLDTATIGVEQNKPMFTPGVAKIASLVL